MKDIVKTTDLTKRYGDLCPCQSSGSVSERRERFTDFWGQTERAKSTTLKMLLGLVHPTAGEIRYCSVSGLRRKAGFPL